ncbi:MAG TPA: hypothetical protein VE081_03575 [Sporichthyaceae bacterium]|nr:hypothetical protein [Sporichthyaceae bacterium]
MESYGAGWNDEDADPPRPSLLSRLPTTTNKRIAVGVAVLLAVGGGFWVTHRGGGTKVGDCAIDQSTDAYSPAVNKAACTDPAAVWEVAAKTTFAGPCPTGDYVKLAALGGGNPYNYQPAGQGTALCLALHVRQGECLHIHIEAFTSDTGSILPREIDCSLGMGTERYRITAIRTDTVDRGVCPKTALPFSYSTPHEVICASVLA